MADPLCSIEAILLTRQDCLLCHEAEALLTRLAAEYPLAITIIEGTTPAGQAVAEQYRLPFSPSLVLGGVAFGYGRLSEGALRREIERGLSIGAEAGPPAAVRKGRVRRALTQLLTQHA
jgi:hypothetical protein